MQSCLNDNFAFSNPVELTIWRIKNRVGTYMQSNIQIFSEKKWSTHNVSLNSLGKEGIETFLDGCGGAVMQHDLHFDNISLT